MEPVDGLEPPTCWLQISCTTNCAILAYGAPDQTRTGTLFRARDFKSLVSTYSTTGAFGCKRLDSNQRSPAYEAGEIGHFSTLQYFYWATGLSPVGTMVGFACAWLTNDLPLAIKQLARFLVCYIVFSYLVLLRVFLFGRPQPIWTVPRRLTPLRATLTPSLG